MKASADIVVFSPDNQPQLIVEVKGGRGATDEWAAKMRRNLVVYGVIPKAKFFLLALPEYFYLWRDNASTELVPADFKVRVVEALAPYAGGIPLEALGEDSFELVVSSWLSDLISSELTQDAAGPKLRWLFDSGLYEAIKHGSLEIESAA